MILDWPAKGNMRFQKYIKVVRHKGEKDHAGYEKPLQKIEVMRGNQEKTVTKKNSNESFGSRQDQSKGGITELDDEVNVIKH